MMKSINTIQFIIAILIFAFASGSACNSEAGNSKITSTQNNDDLMDKIKITVGDKIFIATLSDNATATALKNMLPLTLNMNELNGNEKFFHLSTNLPTNASNPGTIQAGDLMLWGSNSLVLFYKTFQTSYQYTRIGRIDDAVGLASALGSGNVMVTFELR